MGCYAGYGHLLHPYQELPKGNYGCVLAIAEEIIQYASSGEAGSCIGIGCLVLFLIV